MAIRITGTIGNLPIDLTIDGLDLSALKTITDPIINANAGTQSPEPTSSRPQKSDADYSVANNRSTAGNRSSIEQAYQNIINRLKAEQQLLASEIISDLSSQAFDDLSIKRCLLFLRERGQVKVSKSSDGLQWQYSYQPEI